MKQPPNLPTGVLLAPNGTYYARLQIARKMVYFRGFKTPEEASECRERVRRENPKTKPRPYTRPFKLRGPRKRNKTQLDVVKSRPVETRPVKADRAEMLRRREAMMREILGRIG
jgi:hypothetical protein